MRTYYLDVDLDLDRALTEDEPDTLLDDLAHHGAALSTADTELGVSLAVEVGTVRAASAFTEEERRHENSMTLIPDLVSYAEIAAIAGVSRQRARELAKNSDFPKPTVSTATGPLRTRSSVEAWAKTRSRKPGRPKVLAQRKRPPPTQVGGALLAIRDVGPGPYPKIAMTVLLSYGMRHTHYGG